MSIVFTLTAMAVALSVTGVSAAAWATEAIKEEKYGCDIQNLEPVRTCIANRELLIKTLEEHGFHVQEHESSIIVCTNTGSLRFFKTEEEEAYWVVPFELDVEEFGCCADEITEEYLLNVQKNNYETIMEQLKGNAKMHLESEMVLEDDTILLTIQI